MECGSSLGSREALLQGFLQGLYEIMALIVLIVALSFIVR